MSTDKCDREIYTKGTPVAVIADRSAKGIERFVNKIARKTGQRIDWHYIGGRGVIKCVGDSDKVRRAIMPYTNGWLKVVEENGEWTKKGETP